MYLTRIDIRTRNNMGYGIYCEDLEAIGKELKKENKMIVAFPQMSYIIV